MWSRDESRLRSETKHECELSEEEDLLGRYISSGCCVELRRRFRRCLLLDETNARSRIYLKSAYVIKREKIRHLRFHYYMIHPFSAFRVYWEISMIGIFLTILIIIPVRLVFENLPIVAISAVIDFVCMMDIILTFITGYVDNETAKVILKRKKVARKYILSWFILDFMASINFSLFTFYLKQWSSFFQHCVIIKSLRTFTLIKYINRFCEYKQSSIYRFKIFKLILITLLTILWGTAFLYILVVDNVQNWSVHYIHDEYFLIVCYQKVLAMIYLCDASTTTDYFSVVLMEIVCLFAGFVIHLIIISRVLQIVSKYSSSGKKSYQMSQQVEGYMHHKQLPLGIRNRILKYFDFRFQQNYYKESEILAMLSPQLRQEMLVHTYMHLLEKVHIFEKLPLQVLYNIINHMRPEIYLPSDVIVVAGTPGDSMFFILSGTVAIYTATGKEICHLSDGSNFGEVALIMENEHRMATVVAIDSCEIFLLQRKDFVKQLERFPEMHSRIRRIEQDRVRRNFVKSLGGDSLSETSDLRSEKSSRSYFSYGYIPV